MAILEIGRTGHLARNPRNGRFLKGVIPFNKGKKWSEYLDPATAERCLRAGLKNLHGRMDIGGWNKRPVMAILDGRSGHSSQPAEYLGLLCRQAEPLRTLPLVLLR